MIIGDRLRALREEKILSQGDIEKRTALIRCYVSRVENGHTIPAIETIEKFARALEVPMYQLFYFYNPMSNRRDMPAGDTRYFPLTVTFRQQGWARVWAAACMYMNSRSNIVIRMIPVLDAVNECNRIGDESFREKCRQLNTYRAAFVHVDSYEEVKKDKALCNEVDHAGVSKTCLWQLDLYVANPAFGYVRPMKPQVNEPTPEGMFPDSLAGVPVMKVKHCGPRLEFSGRVMCAAGYGSETKELVAVYIEEFPEEEQSTKPAPWNPHTQIRKRQR